MPCFGHFRHRELRKLTSLLLCLLVFVFLFFKNYSSKSEPYFDILSTNEREIAKILGPYTFCGIPAAHNTMDLGK